MVQFIWLFPSKFSAEWVKIVLGRNSVRKHCGQAVNHSAGFSLFGWTINDSSKTETKYYILSELNNMWEIRVLKDFTGQVSEFLKT